LNEAAAQQVLLIRAVEGADGAGKLLSEDDRGYAGRAAAESPATGLAKRHEAEQAALVADALGLSVRSEIRRRKKN